MILLYNGLGETKQETKELTNKQTNKQQSKITIDIIKDIKIVILSNYFEIKFLNLDDNISNIFFPPLEML